MSLAPVTRHYARRTGADGTPAQGSGIEWYAGGTDVIPLTRTRVLEIDTVVDLKAGDDDGTGPGSAIEPTDGGWAVGALATLAELAADDGVAAAHPAIRDAISQAATPQIRHRATVGGNLLQRPRCSYYRDAEVSCWMKGGEGCPAKEGRHEHHALVDEPCIATQPSDLASVLVAIGASVDVDGPDGERTVPVDELLARPSADRRALHTLGAGEVITALRLPAGGARSTYLKAMDRAVWQFALVGVAAVVEVGDGGEVTSASLVASGVDSVPRRLGAAGDALVGSPLSAEAIAAAAAVADEGLVPRPQNRYKQPLLRGLVQRSLERLAAG